ncbi:MAG: S8 family serine peptidase [Chloroflexi bacterium]|nr:S8 family serine peptidase [Chloroflexota bacterium]
MNRKLLVAAGAALLLIASTLPAASATNKLRPNHYRSSAIPPISKLDRSLVGESSRLTAVVTLVSPPVASVAGAAKQRARGAKIASEQDAVLARLQALDGKAKLLGRTRIASNALLVQADSAKLAELASDARVLKIARVRDYQIDLSETVPYIGATAVHGAGFTGEGITVAVLDSGIDYTHASFGGAGTKAAYTTAYGTKTKHAQNRMINESFQGKKLFPTSKVVGGFDFVGEAWTGGAGSPALRPDPDPIDCSPTVIGCGGGHGTHVADIIGGLGGVAPDADLLAIKVCSSITTSCSGVALLQAMDFALDPNGDGMTTDRADVLNMSLGSQYGQSDDDSLSAAVAVASAAGTLVVASAGNGGDKPYVTGTPAAAPSALSVAQTAVPSAVAYTMFIKAGGTLIATREAVFQPWSGEFTAAHAVTGATVQYGDGAGGNLNGCAAFAAGSLTGKVVLVDRGTCTFSGKISNIANGGGLIGIIGLIASGDPFEGGLGDCPGGACALIPGFMVSQSTATLLKDPANKLDFDPAAGVPLVMHMVGSSSRGPDNDHNLIKPEIGAPGASVSAEVGTGTGTTPFGGTSGAAPMVTGSAALLREAFPGRSPAEIKAVLINTGFTDILNRPAVFGGELAPITRIGGGEVRVDRALATDAAAWDDNAPTAALNFGFHDITAGGSTMRTVRVRNYGGSAITYDLASTFRFANDLANGAVVVSTSVPSLTVPAHGDGTFDVTVTVTGSALRTWTLDSGINGASASRLQTLEYDGYLWLDATGTADDIHLPWQVLPRKSGNISASDTSVESGDTVTFSNDGVGRAYLGSYSLLASSPNDADTGTGDDFADVDLRYVGIRQFTDAQADLGCDSSIAIQFAVNTWDRQVHANGPALFEFDLDIGQDGTIDFAVFNFDLSNSGALSDGRNFTWAFDVADGSLTAFWPTVHATNSGNTVLTVCGEQIGLDAANSGELVDVLVLAADWYNSGAVTDVALGTFRVGQDRYDGTFSFGPFGTRISGGAAADVTVVDAGTTGTTEAGLLVLTDETLLGVLGFGESGGSPQVAEAIVIEISP